MSFLLLALETLLAPIAALGVVLSFALSRRRGVLAGLSSELPERFGGLSPAARAKLAGRTVWWLHAASAGEVGGLSPLIAEIAKLPDAPAVLVTTATVAGRAAARRDPGVAWAQLAPLDAWPCVARFLRAARPSRLMLTETELWPSTLILAARAGLRPVLVNARLTRRSLPRYRLAAPLLRPALDSLAAVLAQSEPDAERFRELGVPADKIRATGNTKYDRLPPPADAGPAAAALEKLGWAKAPLIVAGSTHPVEEEMILQAFLGQNRPDLRLVVAPRHVERADEAFATVGRNGRAIRWSALSQARGNENILLIDAMGILPSLWPRAAIAFVGGTLVPVGGHNLLEPALAGAPVLFGPFTNHIEHPSVLLENGGGGRRVHDASELGAAFADLLDDPTRARGIGSKARSLAEGLKGASSRTLAAFQMIK